jgi:probable F420-dependent oxidoreductase
MTSGVQVPARAVDRIANGMHIGPTAHSDDGTVYHHLAVQSDLNGHRLKLGIFLPQGRMFDTRTGILDGARAAERIGYDSVWVYERLLYAQDQTGEHRLTEYGDGAWPAIYRSVPEPLIALSMAAAVTTRVNLGTALLLPPLHMPVRLAKSLATLDAASNGRLIAGLGTGWAVDEFTATAPRPREERGDALDEFLDIAQAVWGPDPVAFKNERYQIFPAEFGPKPTRPIPVLLSGGTRKALDRVARRAAAWLPAMVPADKVKSTLASLRQKAAEYGRNPEDLSCTAVVALFSLDEVPERDRRPYTGSISQVMQDVVALGEAGVAEIILTVPNLARSVPHYVDLAEEFHQRIRQAGIAPALR